MFGCCCFVYIHMPMRYLLILFSLIFFSCSLQNSYTVIGECDESLNGSTVALAYSNGGVRLERISECEVSDGRFFFEGRVNGYKLCYIYNLGVDTPIISQLFLEGGRSFVSLSAEGCIEK